MKTLTEMNTSELWTLRAEVEQSIEILKSTGYSNPELKKFFFAIDDELTRRGA